MKFGLAVVLGLVALVRPVLSIAGVFGDGPLARPVGPVLITVLISVGWVLAAVLARVPDPILTLTVAGVAYAVFAILLNLSLQPVLSSAEPIPPAGYVAIPVFNALLGAALGVVAWFVRRFLRRPR